MPRSCCPARRATGGGSGNPVTFSSSDTNIASCSGTNGTTITIVGAGSCSIYANQAGNGSYDAATQVSQTLTVNKAAQSITFNSIATQTYGTADFSPGATSATSGINAINYSSSNTNVATIVSGNIHIVGVGTSTITANQGSSANYNAASPATQTLTVNPRTVTLINGHDGVWETASNWSSAAVPSVGDNVVIPNTVTNSSLAINSAVTINRLTLAKLTLTVNNGASLSIIQNDTYQQAVTLSAGAIINNGTTSISCGAATTSPTLVTLQGDGSSTTSASFTSTGTLNLNTSAAVGTNTTTINPTLFNYAQTTATTQPTVSLNET